MIAKIPNENDSAARKENNWDTLGPKRIPLVTIFFLLPFIFAECFPFLERTL